MRDTIRSWNLPRRSDKAIEDLSRMLNPIIRGWLQYYGRYYRSALYPTMRAQLQTRHLTSLGICLGICPVAERVVGVGIMIAHNPLHRSGRAELPHPAPTLGKNAQAHERIRLTYLSRREPSLDVARYAAPRHVVTLAATTQYRPPQVTHGFAKSTQCRTIHGHSVIAEVTQQDRA